MMGFSCVRRMAVGLGLALSLTGAAQALTITGSITNFNSGGNQQPPLKQSGIGMTWTWDSLSGEVLSVDELAFMARDVENFTTEDLTVTDSSVDIRFESFWAQYVATWTINVTGPSCIASTGPYENYALSEISISAVVRGGTTTDRPAVYTADYANPTATDGARSEYSVVGLRFTDGVGALTGSYRSTTATDFSATTPTPVPLPAGFPLLATALGVLVWMRRRKA